MQLNKFIESKALLAAMCLLFLASCNDRAEKIPIPGKGEKTAASERAKRRLYDGAPPIIPHQNFQIICTACHNERGMAISEMGFAPAFPHGQTKGMSKSSRCLQCHVFITTTDIFVANDFQGIKQNLRKGQRLYRHAPPVTPHRTFMREHCAACHTGDATREQIRCTHPERINCRQCHIPANTSSTFQGIAFASDPTPK